MKKTWISLMLMACLSIAMIGCDGGMTPSDKNLAIQQEASMQEAVAQTGMPSVKNFTERKLMKTIIELRDQENLICYAYLYVEMTGDLKYFGKCIGFGLPYATQYTNPEKKQNDGAGPYILPQADPNGLFMPAAAEATWLMMIDPRTNEPHPVYVESRVIVSPFPLQ
jgi:hypothetical protein